MSDERWGDMDDRSDARDERRERDDRRAIHGTREAPRARPQPGLDRLSSEREIVSFRGHDYRMNERDVELMRAVGTFRAVYADHLRDAFPSLDAQVRHLREEGVLAVERVDRPDRQERAELLTLTREGHRLVSATERDEQHYYAGLVQPRELEHDANLYRLVEVVREQAEARGGHIERVRLDDELKQLWWSRELEDLAAEERAKVLSIGLDHEGRAVFPDVQIDIRAADGALERENLELVTRHYNSRSIKAKSAAGFRMFRLRGAGNRGSRGGDTNRDSRGWDIIGG